MRYQPSLQTARLRLRPFVADDAETLVELSGSAEMPATNMALPASYSITAAKTWIAGLPHHYRSGSAIHFAVCLLETKQLIGSFALQNIDTQNASAELKLWIIQSRQQQGYGGEALQEVRKFAFSQLELHRICVYHFAEDSVTARFLGKYNFQQEGILRHAVRTRNSYMNIAITAHLAEE